MDLVSSNIEVSNPVGLSFQLRTDHGLRQSVFSCPCTYRDLGGEGGRLGANQDAASGDDPAGRGDLRPRPVHVVPALIADLGDEAALVACRYVEFFTANIRNRTLAGCISRAFKPLPGLVRKSQRLAKSGCMMSRQNLGGAAGRHLGTVGQAAARGDPHAFQPAGDRPGGAG
jgi:hypothetical protein